MRRSLTACAIGALILIASVAPAQAGEFGPTPNLVKDIDPGLAKSFLDGGVALGSRFVFSANDGGGGDNLPWITDGTKAGTKALSTVAFDPKEFTAFNGKIYFSAADANGRELWRTDGTTAGTVRAYDLNAGPGNSDPAGLTVAGTALYFDAKPAGSGKELYRFNAPPAIGPAQPPINVTGFGGTAGVGVVTAFGSNVVFSSSGGGNGWEPWIYESSGPTLGKHQLKDINTAGDSFPSEFTVLGDSVVFRADDAGANGFELWVTKGTPATTALVKDINPGAGNSFPQHFTAYDGGLLFQATTVADGTELWATDGTHGGTQLVYDIAPDSTPSDPSFFTVFNGSVYFSAKTGPLGYELWVTRGGPGTTHLVKDIYPGTSNSAPRDLKVSAGSLYFSAGDASHGDELWRSNGTASGTVRISDIQPGLSDSFPTLLGSVSNTLFYSADDGVHGFELWSYTTRGSATRITAKSSYSRATDKNKKVYVSVKVTATGTVPTGKVTLKLGSTVIGSGTLSSGKVSIRLTKTLGKGSHKIRAYYAGSVRARTSTSALTIVKVN